MNLSIQRRAEITLRSLSPSERKTVIDALNKLRLLDDTEVGSSPNILKLQSTNLYRYRVGRFRIILSKNDSGWTVEDIMYRDKFDRLGLESKQVQKA